jgi:hypothetical protein
VDVSDGAVVGEEAADVVFGGVKGRLPTYILVFISIFLGSVSLEQAEVSSVIGFQNTKETT